MLAASALVSFGAAGCSGMGAQVGDVGATAGAAESVGATESPNGVESGAAASATAPVVSVVPLYYAFAFDANPDSPGCGPQGRFVKVDGTRYYEVSAIGCDGSADRGVIVGDQVDLLGAVDSCGPNPPTEFPRIMAITGGPTDLRIPGETRVVGPTADIADLDVWWSEENERARFPSPRNANRISEWMLEAAATNWVGNSC